MNRECNQLDAYLADDLPVRRTASFERHLAQCSVCREALDAQQWIDNLLQSAARLQVEPVPVELVALTRSAVSQRRLRVRLAACGLAAAAMLFVAAGWWELNRQANGRMNAGAGRGEAAERVVPSIAAEPKATFVGSADVIAVPVESNHADVTIVRIYPIYRPPEKSQTAAIEPAAAGDFTWPDSSNGG